MNFVKISLFATRARARRCSAFVLGMTLLSCTFLFSGCGDDIQLPTADQLVEFSQAGPVEPAVDVDRLIRAKLSGGAYHVLPGEVLELTMPSILQVVTAEAAVGNAIATPYLCRITDEGTISLPVVGEIPVAGKTLAEIEKAVIDIYYPKYTVTRPSVFARIIEYRESKVTITGAVASPGVYALKSDQMSVVSLIMEAGGIDEEGAAAIRILRESEDATDAPTETSETPDAIEEEPEEEAQPEAPEVDVVLSFDMESGDASMGDLRIEHEGETILLEDFDLKDSGQHDALKAMLSQKDPILAKAVEEQLQGLISVMNGVSPDQRAESKSLDATAMEMETSRDVIESQAQEMIEAHDAAKDDDNQILLPVRGMNIPFADVVLEDGDTVIVERLQQPLFTVLGLVNKPGNFPYPSHARYNLMQALGFAQGLDPTAEPRYATIYRLKPGGGVVNATYRIVRTSKGPALTDSLGVPIKPGDIVAVEHTPRTRANVFFDKMFRINLGAYMNWTDLAGND